MAPESHSISSYEAGINTFDTADVSVMNLISNTLEILKLGVLEWSIRNYPRQSYQEIGRAHV